MNNLAIRVDNLSKKYILSHQLKGSHGGSVREAITEFSRGLVNSINPKNKRKVGASREEFWALKDISFEINQGDRVGIIGRNGAGKSTLLKVLSRITEPTDGSVRIRGRVASLLEVGTGFHPELTGRENIFLNGAILGMSKVEIERKFDEIVDFAEVEKFLDTPVKRYSSGMYVRLAFSVAAHLEPEILIVDEVLAVGDVQFQKKCLGKMQDVSSNHERTVLFVSHNMDAIQRLCSKCLVLENGRVLTYGDAAESISHYLSNDYSNRAPNSKIDLSNSRRTGTGKAYFASVQYSSLNEQAALQAYTYGQLEFSLEIYSDSDRTVGSLAIIFYSVSGIKLLNADIEDYGETIRLKKGLNPVKLRIEKLYLQPQTYVIGLYLAQSVFNSNHDCFDYIESAFELEVIRLKNNAENDENRSNDDALFVSDAYNTYVASDLKILEVEAG